ncbi:hypothetical protein D0O09_01975 [Pseudomonas putida]|nr:hypothetical protein D0O09_01975 [Pseudomonas putida]
MPVRQGDILINRDHQTGKIESTYLVITADCDISKEKFGSQIAALRIISHNSYLMEIWGEKKLSKAVKDELSKLHVQITKWHSKLINTDSSLTANAALDWLMRAGSDEIVKSLSVPEDQSARVKKSLNNAYNAFKLLENEKLSDLEKFVQFRAHSEEKSPELVLEATVGSAQKEALPDDTFFLPELPEKIGEGAVIMLREIIGIDPKWICLKATEAVSTRHYLRIARLKPEIKYAVSQAFGSLYSRIGMSAEYEARRKTAIQGLTGKGWKISC